MSTELANSASAVAIESFVTRGDWSQLSPLDRARAYTHVCAQHGLNPMSQPFAFLRLNGKEVLYATRGATDQLAAMHKVTRKIIDGPKVIDIAGSKVAYCVAEASLPGGRSETATATLPVADPVNLYMKLETKAKRRATIALLGLAMLDETELATIPADAQSPAPQPSREDIARAVAQPATITRETFAAMDASAQVAEAAEVRALAPPPSEPADVVADIEIQVGRCGSVGQLADLWIAARADVARLPKAAQTRAWKLVGQRAEAIGSTAGHVRAEVTRRDTTPPDGPDGGGQKPAPAPQHADAQGSAAEAAPAQGALAMVPAWCTDFAAMEAHVATYAHPLAVERCARKHRAGLPPAARELLALRYQRLSWDPHDGEVTIESARRLVATWIAQGPVERVRPAARAKIAAGGAQ